MQRIPMNCRKRNVLGHVLLVAMVASSLAGCGNPTTLTPDSSSSSATSSPGATSTTGIPKLVDLGAGKCIPCKLMAPILDELKKEYEGSLEVVFIDVWQEKGAGEKYGIRSIPTQIFYDPAGRELFRHEGLFTKEEILAKWDGLGFKIEKKPTATPAS